MWRGDVLKFQSLTESESERAFHGHLINLNTVLIAAFRQTSEAYCVIAISKGREGGRERKGGRQGGGKRERELRKKKTPKTSKSLKNLKMHPPPHPS